MAKGYGILCVILGHISFHGLSIWIYSFHIPLFFFLSGYLFNENRPFVPFLRKKMKTLLIPYAFFSFLYICFDNEFIISLYSLKTICINFVLQQRYTPLWFISSLFVANILFYFLLKIFHNIYFQILISLFFSIFIAACWHDKNYSMFWNADISIFVIPYMLIANYANKYDLLNVIIQTNKYLFLFICIVSNIVIGGINYIMSGEMIDLFNNTLGYFPLAYLEAIFGIFVVFIISTLKKSNVVQYIGRNSLVFFALHLMVYDFVRFLYFYLGFFQSSLSTSLLLIRDLISLILILVFLYPLNELILHSRLKFLIGQ
jgi:fucose 4-O-acetylase-like acetyltransferase